MMHGGGRGILLFSKRLGTFVLGNVVSQKARGMPREKPFCSGRYLRYGMGRLSACAAVRGKAWKLEVGKGRRTSFLDYILGFSGQKN